MPLARVALGCCLLAALTAEIIEESSQPQGPPSDAETFGGPSRSEQSHANPFQEEMAALKAATSLNQQEMQLQQQMQENAQRLKAKQDELENQATKAAAALTQMRMQVQDEERQLDSEQRVEEQQREELKDLMAKREYLDKEIDMHKDQLAKEDGTMKNQEEQLEQDKGQLQEEEQAVDAGAKVLQEMGMPAPLAPVVNPNAAAQALVSIRPGAHPSLQPNSRTLQPQAPPGFFTVGQSVPQKPVATPKAMAEMVME